MERNTYDIDLVGSFSLFGFKSVWLVNNVQRFSMSVVELKVAIYNITIKNADIFVTYISI